MVLLRKIVDGFILMRPRQWIKNGFVFVPPFFGGKLGDFSAMGAAFSTFVIFCLTASAVYIFNDFRDRAADAAHPEKKRRPLASGAISPLEGIALAIANLAIVSTVAVSFELPANILVCLAIYVAINLTYTLGLKHVSILELFLVASGYVIRVVAGSTAVNLVPSSWLLSVTGVIALLIVTAKRRGEIAEGNDPKTMRLALRGYNLTFLDSMISMLTAMTLIIYLLFTTSEYAASRFGQNAALLTAPVVGYGVLRYVQLTKVGKGADDPTELVLGDPGIATAVAIFVFMFAVILYL